jgi:hypothetical protein
LTDGLKWARHMRLELAFEIQKLESGIRKVTEKKANRSVDVTREVLAAQKERFEQLDEMIEALDGSPAGAPRAA